MPGNFLAVYTVKGSVRVSIKTGNGWLGDMFGNAHTVVNRNFNLKIPSVVKVKSLNKL